MDAPATEAGLRHHEGAAPVAEQVLDGHAAHPRSGCRRGPLPRLVPPGDAHVAHNGDPRRIGRDDEHGVALIGGVVGLGDHHHYEKGGPAGVRGEPLLAVDHPLVAVELGPGGEFLGIGTGLRLRHGIGGEELPVEQWLEIPFLVLLGPVVSQDLGIAGVRSLAAENDRGQAGPAEDLVEQAELDLAVALAAEFRTEMRRPQAAVLDSAWKGGISSLRSGSSTS